MNTQQPVVSMKKIMDVFAKIHKGLNKEQLNELDKELLKIYPSEQSEVLVSTDYSEENNSVGVSIYVSEPKTNTTIQKLPFNQLMSELLQSTDIDKLKNIWKCLELMERTDRNDYEVDFIPVFYTKEINQFDIHFRIIKNSH